MIILSPGHHAEKRGASNGTYTEYPYTLAWAVKIQALIKRSGLSACKVVYPGRGREKVKEINEIVRNETRECLAVEIHFNAGGGHGCETLYCPGSKTGQMVATKYHLNLMPRLAGIRDRGIKPGYHRMNPNNPPNYFLRATHCPAILLETLFITELALYSDQDDLICSQIASSLIHAHSYL